jgi:hypothetical protein
VNPEEWRHKTRDVRIAYADGRRSGLEEAAGIVEAERTHMDPLTLQILAAKIRAAAEHRKETP